MNSASSAFSYGSPPPPPPPPSPERGGGRCILQKWRATATVIVLHSSSEQKENNVNFVPWVVALNYILPLYRVSTFFPFRRFSGYCSRHASVMHYGHVFHILELQFELLSIFNFWCWHVTLSFYFAFCRNQNSSWGQKHAICKSLANSEIAIAHILLFNSGASCNDAISPVCYRDITKIMYILKDALSCVNWTVAFLALFDCVNSTAFRYYLLSF